jgi:pimeloyl-ACP methyl ester carboxylesterase
MRAAHPTLDEAMIGHLVRHGVRPADGGGLVWKHDRRMMIPNPADLSLDQQHALWAAITCPTLLVYGTASWASNPLEDGRAARMPAAEVELIDGAGHWVQHDRFDAFMAAVERFL